MNDDIVFQQGDKDGEENSSGNIVPNNLPTEDSEAAGDSKVFDFSSDLNISVVKDEQLKTASMAGAAAPVNLPKATTPANIPQNPFKPLVMPGATKTVSAPTSIPASAPSPATSGAPTTTPGSNPPRSAESIVKESLAALNQMGGPKWPFASQSTVDQHIANNPPPPKPKVAPDPNSPNLLARTPDPMPVISKDTPQTAQANQTNQTKQAPSSAARPQPTPIFVPSPAEAPSLASLSAKKPVLSTGDANTVLKNLRTYEGDIAEVLAHRGTSSVSAAIAESKRRGEGATLSNKPEPETRVISKPRAIPADEAREKEPTHVGSKLIIVLICIILIGAGTTLGYYLYSKSPLSTVTPAKKIVQRTLPSLIPSDSQTVIPLDGTSPQNILVKIGREVAKSQTGGSIKEIILTETKDTAVYRISAQEMLSKLSIPMPNIIARTLTPEWMLGSYTDVNGSRTAFVALSTNLFQNAFAGMLTWENSIIADLRNIIPGASEITSTGSGSFQDRIIKNKDVRAYVTADGRTLFEYSFVNNQILVIAANDTVMNAVITRLESKAFVR